MNLSAHIHMHAYTFQSGQWFHVLNAVSVHISTRKRPPRARASFVNVCMRASSQPSRFAEKASPEGCPNAMCAVGQIISPCGKEVCVTVKRQKDEVPPSFAHGGGKIFANAKRKEHSTHPSFSWLSSTFYGGDDLASN